MGVMAFHKFCDMRRSCLIERRLDVRACQIHCWAHDTAMSQHGSPFLADLSSQLAGADNLLRQLLPRALSSSSQVLFLIRDEESYKTRTTSTSPTSVQWLCNFRFLSLAPRQVFVRTPFSQSSTNLVPPSGPRTPRNGADLLRGQLLDHLAYHCIHRSVNFVFRDLLPWPVAPGQL